MPSRSVSVCPSRVRSSALAALAILAFVLPAIGLSADERQLPKPNYDLAARWMATKVGKLVFDTTVAPRWAETTDRFWYAFETAQGRKFILVDPLKRTKAPLWDNARMAAMLTGITRIPYDSQHLPMTPATMKWVKNDTVIRFELEVPKDAVIVGEKKAEPPKAGDKKTDDKKTDEKTQKTDDKTQIDQKTDQTKKEDVKKEDVKKDDTKKDDVKKDETKKDEKAEGEEEPKTTKTLYFEYDLATAKVVLLPDFKGDPKKPGWAQISPDDKTIIFARGHNLFMMDADNYKLALKDFGDPKVQEVQITTDGEENYSFARRLNDEAKTTLKKDQKGDTKHKDGPRVPAINLFWSRNSTKIAAVRTDARKVADLWVINSLATPRPKLETYRYAMPGEENVDQQELLVIDRDTKKRTTMKADAFKDQSLQVATARAVARDREKEKTEPRWLSDTPDTLYFWRLSRDLHRVDVCVANTETGEVKTVIEERLNTYIETQPLWTLGNGQEFIHWSERDGWGHYYLFDAAGTLKNQITTGEYVTGPIVYVDDKLRVMYFMANGRETGEDPYFTHMYRVNLDGTGLKLLDPGDASHAAVVSDSGKYLIDTYSQVNTAPKSELFDAAGLKLTDLEQTDVSALTEAGFKFPEPFKVKADDGVTDLFGVMYKPFDFDPAKRYPIIAFVYPGPQTESVTKTFSPRSANIALANMGFVVIEVGNRGGNPQRSKWYHNYGYGNLRDYGLADKKAAIEQLARKNAWIDMNLVGIYGHSGGGFMSTAALLVYPDFFKVAVSSSGNHENNVYNRWWSEKHHGVKEVTDKDGKVKFEYTIDRNSEIAKNLKGHLMLVTGDMDDNVHMANTLRVADALIKANKRFDFFVMPGQRHSYGPLNDYFFWLRADYFAKYLLGASSETVDILELSRETPQGGAKRPVVAATGRGGR
ncbi:MAG: DPP IV N-terminal domain-containing protein [Acidobacteria bacterium]|nr:DPP IV N-terminal domain-containing protein [Acidobacteriota bacterium]